jgi:hypothetical protein
MTTENVAAAMPRLERLRQVVDHDVSLDLEFWVRRSGADCMWALWDGERHFKGSTIDEVLSIAEGYHGIGEQRTVETVVLPVCADSPLLEAHRQREARERRVTP